jgi:hypothetical protein
MPWYKFMEKFCKHSFTSCSSLFWISFCCFGSVWTLAHLVSFFDWTCTLWVHLEWFRNFCQRFDFGYLYLDQYGHKVKLFVTHQIPNFAKEKQKSSHKNCLFLVHILQHKRMITPIFVSRIGLHVIKLRAFSPNVLGI